MNGNNSLYSPMLQNECSRKVLQISLVYKYFNFKALTDTYIKKLKTMILTTTNSIEGFKITDYLGLVSGVGANTRKTSFSFSMEKFLKTLENSIEEVKEDAFQKLRENAIKLGANAVVGISIDFETVPNTTYILVSTTGTAVKVSWLL